MTMKQRFARWKSAIGKVRLYRFRGAGYVLAPGDWTPRFDQHGRIYMVIAPADHSPPSGRNAE